MIDLIDRQAAIDAVNNAFDRETLLTGFVRSIAVRAIRDVPTIEPEREKGKWIPIDEDSDVYECDVCRTTYDTICGTFDLPYFCPHCGADMRGDQNG